MADGYLYLTALKQDANGQPYYGGQHYTSARITTQNSASWLYGYFEVRAKMPCGAGTEPVIWTLGTKGSWPARGELDFGEMVGKQNTTIVQTVHDTYNQSHNGDATKTTISDACTAFHRYEMLWTADSIQMEIDGKVVSTYSNQGTGTAQWPFNSPQYLLLLVALGNSWAGPVDDSALPQSMVIDYVRIYQKN